MFKESLDRLANLSTSVSSLKKNCLTRKKHIEGLNTQLIGKNSEIELLKKQMTEKDTQIQTLNTQLQTCQANQVDLAQLDTAIKKLEDILGK